MDAYLNGQYLPIEECKVSVLDRGFVFGDGVYELIPVYAGNAFRLSEHVQRLLCSLNQIQIDPGKSAEEWAALVEDIVERSKSKDLAVYIQVSRGTAPRDHAYPKAEPTVFAMANPLAPVAKEWLDNGVSVVSVEDIRWDRCDIKVTSLLANVMLKQKAIESGATEALLIRDGIALEGSASNLFVVDNGTVYTAEKNNLILPGITRDFVVELVHDLDIPMKEAAVSEDVLRQADELWMTSSTKEVVAINQLDGKPVGDGVPGPIWRKVHAHFQKRKAAA